MNNNVFWKWINVNISPYYLTQIVIILFHYWKDKFIDIFCTISIFQNPFHFFFFSFKRTLPRVSYFQKKNNLSLESNFTNQINFRLKRIYFLIHSSPFKRKKVSYPTILQVYVQDFLGSKGDPHDRVINGDVFPRIVIPARIDFHDDNRLPEIRRSAPLDI